ncbi:MAG: glycosyl transferase [Candidatus Rokuibacteriota bacterium]|nr:MAG: glycosyl transferase [Candidatus Rokubacteria bacterium]
MMPTLSVVLPVHNEAVHLPATIEALVEALTASDFEAELVLVDDGSTDGSADAARQALRGRAPFSVVSQPNRGRFEARRAGVEVARGEWVLLLDGRVRLHAGSLAFVSSRVDTGERVWTGHVEVLADGNPFGVFWKLLAELAWADYFDDPRTTSFGGDDFDRYPKGTTSFLAPRSLLLEAIAAFRSRYSNSRAANDDTPLIRWIAEREPIHVSPRFTCDYRPRSTLRAFLRHSYHRGLVFLDGHGRRESRFFPLVVAFYPVSAVLALAALRRPAVVPLAAGSTAAAAAALGLAHSRERSEVASLALLAPVYGLAHGAGMWRGLLMMLTNPR